MANANGIRPQDLKFIPGPLPLTGLIVRIYSLERNSLKRTKLIGNVLPRPAVGCSPAVGKEAALPCGE